MASWSKGIAIAAALAVTGFSTASHAAFIIDPHPGGVKLFLDKAKDASTTFGDVINPDDVVISAVGSADFADGFANIKPVKDGSLTELVFTPVNPDAFNDFSFRGQDISANQTIEVIVTPEDGAPTTLTFFEPKANADFSRIGIVATAGETIKSVEILNSGGFKEGKQYEFSTAPAVVPEPATWAMLLIGFGGLGHAMRSRRRQSLAPD